MSKKILAGGALLAALALVATGCATSGDSGDGGDAGGDGPISVGFAQTGSESGWRSASTSAVSARAPAARRRTRVRGSRGRRSRSTRPAWRRTRRGDGVRARLWTSTPAVDSRRCPGRSRAQDRPRPSAGGLARAGGGRGPLASPDIARLAAEP